MPYLNCTYASLWVSNATAFGINATTVGVINVTFAVPTIVLNLLVLNAFLRKKKLRKSSNIILLSLSLTDVLSGIFIQPLFAISVFNTLDYYPTEIRYPCWLVKGSGIGGYILACISLATISFISLERYIAIFHPYLYSRKVSSKVIVRTCIALWVIPTIVVLTIFLTEGHDLFFWINGIFIGFIYVWNISIYIRISRQVYRVRRELVRLHSRFSTEKTLASQSKVTQVAGSIIVALLLCYLPQIVASLLRIILRHRYLLEYVEYWTVTLALISPCLNPLFYCYYNSEIRKEVFFVLKYVQKEALHRRPASRIPKPAVVASNENRANSNSSNNLPAGCISSENAQENNLFTCAELGVQNAAFEPKFENIKENVSTDERQNVENIRILNLESVNIEEKSSLGVDVDNSVKSGAESNDNDGFQGDAECSAVDKCVEENEIAISDNISNQV